MNIDKLQLQNNVEGNARIEEIMGMSINGSNLLPKPITYKDINSEMVDFVSKKMDIIFGEQEIKTYFFAQQRMSEFTKTWEMLDENKNIIPNFKIVTRENNPQPGTLQGGMFNIPTNEYFNIGTFNKWDGNKNITVTCKMKQPYCVDIIYNIKFVTNRLNLLNELNNTVIDLFKFKQSYITVNGYYMPVVLEDIGDESDYDLDQRKIFVQNYQFKVLGYIINEKDVIFEENIVRGLVGVEIDNYKPNYKFYKNDGNLIINFPRKSKRVYSFKSDDDYHVLSVLGVNISSYDIKINNEYVNSDFYIKKYDNIIINIQRESQVEVSKIMLQTEQI